MRKFFVDPISKLTLKKLPLAASDASLFNAPDFRQDPIPPDDSPALLRKMVPSLVKTADEDLDSLADRLGDLPIALKITGLYLASHPDVTVQEYLAEMDKSAAAINPALLEWAKGIPFSHALDLAAAVGIVLGDLQRKRLARQALTIAGCCHPEDPIPTLLLRNSLGLTEKQQPELDRALEQLYQVGLLELTGQGCAVHPQLAFIAAQASDSSESLFPQLAQALLDLCPSGNVPEMEPPIWPHLRPVAQQAEKMDLKQSGKLWNSLGFVLWKMGERQPAEECFARALPLEEKFSGPDHADAAVVLGNLGRVRSELGDLAGAKTCFERALAIHKTADGVGSKHPAVAADSTDLGRLLLKMNDLAGAKACFEQALEVNEWVHGPFRLEVAAAVGDLGRLNHFLGDYKNARACFKRQLAIEELIYGPEHPSMAQTLNNLGLAHQDLGQLIPARTCFERALSIDEKACSPNHPDVARDKNNLGSVLLDMGDLPQARDLFRQALEINESLEALPSRDIAVNANNLGRVLYRLEDYPNARQCFERALALDENVYGRESPEVATDLTNLGIVLSDLGDLPVARKTYERALAILEKSPAENSKKLTTIRRRLDRLGGKSGSK